MSDYEKKSLFRFLALYLTSTFIFITLIAILFYEVKTENSLELQKEKLKRYSSSIAAEIIDSQMNNRTYNLPVSDEFNIALIGENNTVIYSQLGSHIRLEHTFSDINGHLQIVDTSSRSHHGIKYIVVQESGYVASKHVALIQTCTLWGISFLFASLLAFRLSKQFLKPIRTEMQRIDTFVKASTHELNTPITSILLSIDTLSREYGDSKRLSTLKLSAKMLSNIYGDLTYYLQHESLKKDPEWIDFMELAQTKALSFSALAAEKNVKINVTGDAFLYKIDFADAERLLSNLISNAIKYSYENGQVDITIRERNIRVSDEGIGISNEAKKNIFDKFVRQTDISDGLGLGLFIVKTICDEYHIALELENGEKNGSIFTLQFPR